MGKILLIFVPILIVLTTVWLFVRQNPLRTQPENAAKTAQTSIQTPVPTSQSNITSAQLSQLGSNKYADGNLPLGDGKYTTDAPKKGYIYLCHAQSDQNGGGSQVNGPWIHGSTWNIKEKLSVEGNVSWPSNFSNKISGQNRILSGNDLPTHLTGDFPIGQTDPVYQYDRNPSSISAQNFSDTLPSNPAYSDTPSCMGGEAGIMLTGVALFNGFDAGLRDAAAHEVQDSCQGHPQQFGEYHYHSLSSCINDTSVSTVIGFALDGFPITGPNISQDKYLTTDDLDECHGITSQINLDGKKVNMYHYVMTEDFPYSVSCFRGKPVSMQVIKMNNTQGPQQGGQLGQPPGPFPPPQRP